MLSKISFILAIAFLFYFLLPEASAFLQRKLAARWLSKLKQRANSSGVNAIVSGFLGENLLIKTCASGGFVSVPAYTTAFFTLEKGKIRKIPQKSFLAVPKGISALYIPPKTNARKLKSRSSFSFIKESRLPRFMEQGTCIFFNCEEHNFQSVFDAQRVCENLFKPFFIAAGAFLEFSLFLAFLDNSEHPQAAFTALAAVFGKALPYLPPGTLLTIAGAALAKKPNAGLKAFVLKAAAVLFNVALFFLLEAFFYH